MPVNFKKYQLIIVLITAAISLNILLWVLALKVFPKENIASILHYNASVGVDFIGESGQIIALPQTASVILVMNFLLGLIIWRADKRASLVLWTAIPLTNGILLGAFYLLYQINI